MIDPRYDAGNSEVSRLLADLGADDITKRQHARDALKAKGEAALPALAEALTEAEFPVRWEVAKTLAAMRLPAAAPALVAALEDEEQDVRWVAAEALADLGRDGLRPLLRAVVDRPDSYILNKGTHHVLTRFMEGNPSEPLVRLHTALGLLEEEGEVLAAARQALDSL